MGIWKQSVNISVNKQGEFTECTKKITQLSLMMFFFKFCLWRSSNILSAKSIGKQSKGMLQEEEESEKKIIYLYHWDVTVDQNPFNSWKPNVIQTNTMKWIMWTVTCKY